MSKHKILITGGAGFIAYHLTEVLLNAGHQIAAIDDLSTGRLSNVEILRRNPNFSFTRSSIFNEQVLDRLASDCTIIIHLAAAVGVQLIVEDPVHTIETNVSGTKVVLKAALRYGSRVLVASTSEVYGKGTRIPFHEEDDVLLGPTSKSRWAYAASKMIDEFLSLAYYRQFKLDVVPFRLFNTVGPRQTGQYGMVIPRFVRQALRGEPLTVFGDGMQMRCFGDVRDVVQALSGLAFHPDAAGQVYNIGAGIEISILDLAKRVIALTGSKSEIKLVPYSEAYAPGFEDMQRRVPDTQRIHTLLGWKPTRLLDDTLQDVISYEKTQLNAQA